MLKGRISNEGSALDIVSHGEVGEPHVQNVEPKRCDQNRENQETRPESCVSSKLERNHHDDGGENGQAHQPEIRVDTRVIDGNLPDHLESEDRDHYALDYRLQHPKQVVFYVEDAVLLPDEVDFWEQPVEVLVCSVQLR